MSQGTNGAIGEFSRHGEKADTVDDKSGWPHQVALLATLSDGKAAVEQTLYCNRLLRCSVITSVTSAGQRYDVHCFATRLERLHLCLGSGANGSTRVIEVAVPMPIRGIANVRTLRNSGGCLTEHHMTWSIAVDTASSNSPGPRAGTGELS